MKKKPSGEDRPQVSADSFLRSRPYVNEAIKTEPRGEDKTLVSIPLRRPAWLVRPISWVIPFSSHRRIELDALGGLVLRLCDGRNTVEQIIEHFAAEHKLSFREAQLPVTQFLRLLAQYGIVAIVGFDKDTDR